MPTVAGRAALAADGSRRRGSAKIAATADTSATAAATRTPIAIAWTKALCAAATSSLPAAPPACLPAMSAAATELAATWTTGLGTCAAASTLPSRDR